MQVEVNPEGAVVCGWFAACQRPASHVAPHPVLEHVPVCMFHNDGFELGGQPAEFELDSEALAAVSA